MPQRGIAYQPRVQTLGISPVCEAPSAPLTDGVGSVLDREVYFTTRANGTMTFPVSGHPPCVGTIYLPCVRYQTPITFPVPLPHRVFGTEPPPCFQSHQPEPDSIEIIRHEKLSRFAR